jgi:hypothetical protein
LAVACGVSERWEKRRKRIREGTSRGGRARACASLIQIDVIEVGGSKGAHGGVEAVGIRAEVVNTGNELERTINKELDTMRSGDNTYLKKLPLLCLRGA